MSPTRARGTRARQRRGSRHRGCSFRLSAGAIERSVNAHEDRATLRRVQPLADTLVVDFTRYLPGAYASRELPASEPASSGSSHRPAIPCARPRPPGTLRSASGRESVVCDLPDRRGVRAGALRDAPTSCSKGSVQASRRASASARTMSPNDRLLLDHGLRRRPAPPPRAGHDVNYLGWAGVLEDTAPGLPPIQIADLAAGALGAVTQMLAALLERHAPAAGATSSCR